MNTIVSKRFFTVLCVSLGAQSVLLSADKTAYKSNDKQPNIIYVFTDQQSAGMMSCAGNRWLNTPAMDYIANNGIRFTRAYATNPVSSPSRVSMMTGHFAGNFMDKNNEPVKENRGSMSINNIPDRLNIKPLGYLMQVAGYDAVFGGKRHLPNILSPKSQGFDMLTVNERDVLADSASSYIKKKHEKPFFMIVSLINPHDICYMAIRDYWSDAEKEKHKNMKEIKTLDEALKIPDNVTKEEFFSKYCPPLPPNFEPQEGEPIAVRKFLYQRPFKANARLTYDENRWRMHRWAYCRLVELVDAQIKQILDAVKEAGIENETLIIFSSDHGDMNAAHQFEHKTLLYEESVNIPFMMMWKGHIKPHQVDSTHLISNGLDFFPTVCDYAGIEIEGNPQGLSLKPLVEGKSKNWRNTIGVESEVGSMVLDQEGLKYISYDFEGAREEQLLDLKADPFETKHFTNDAAYTEKLKDMRAKHNEWFGGTFHICY